MSKKIRLCPNCHAPMVVTGEEDSPTRVFMECECVVKKE